MKNLIAILALIIAPISCSAQNVNIVLNQAPVQSAVNTLFKTTNLSYTIDPNITGLVTVSLHAVPFDVALRTILRSNSPELTYSKENGICNIQMKSQQIVVNNVAQQITLTTNNFSVVPLHLNYINSGLLLKYVLSGTNSGYIPSLTGK